MQQVRVETRSRSAELVQWRCPGKDTVGCGKLLLKLDPERPCYVEILCGRCGHRNVWVERYQVPVLP